MLSAASVHLLRSPSQAFARTNHTICMRAFWFVLKERIDRGWPAPANRCQAVTGTPPSRPCRLPATASTGSVLARFDTCRRAVFLIVCSLNTIPGRPRFIVVFEAAFAQQKSWPRFGFECDLSDIAA